jgi:Phage integrase family
LAKAGIRKIRLHDLRHTFGSLLIQAGASIVYVKEQMGHSSIQVTVDTYGHLIPGANVSFVDRLDTVRKEKVATTPQQSATQTQPGLEEETEIPAEVADLIGGGGWTRTSDLRIMSRSDATENKADQQLTSEDSGKIGQNPQARRNPKKTSPTEGD